MIKVLLIYVGIGLIVDIFEVIVANSALYTNPIDSYKLAFAWLRVELEDYAVWKKVVIILGMVLCIIVGFLLWPIVEGIIIFKYHCVMHLY